MEKIENGNVLVKHEFEFMKKNELGNLKLSKGISVVENFNYSIFD